MRQSDGGAPTVADFLEHVQPAPDDLASFIVVPCFVRDGAKLDVIHCRRHAVSAALEELRALLEEFDRRAVVTFIVREQTQPGHALGHPPDRRGIERLRGSRQVTGNDDSALQIPPRRGVIAHLLGGERKTVQRIAHAWLIVHCLADL